jgi:hypothetical protein
VIGVYGYRSVFLFALICVLTALGIVIVLRQMQARDVGETGNRE